MQPPVKIGIVGTGFAAQRRVEAFQSDSRAVLVAVAGNTEASTRSFAQTYGLSSQSSWQALVANADIDLVLVCHVNRDHDTVVRAALEAGKSVVVEYPLSLNPVEAAKLVTLAQQQNLLLHVEHIELLGGLHQAMQAHIAQIGQPAYVRYCTAVPKSPAPEKWTYHSDLFGFPLVGALSRVHRLTNLFGAVDQVFCQVHYDGGASTAPAGYFKHCRCIAQLQFASGLMAEVMYAKGEQTWRSQRWMEIEGDRGALAFEGDRGRFISAQGESPIDVGSRRGLFAQDSAQVLDALFEQRPLYVTPQESLYALQVAAAAERSAQIGKAVTVEAKYPAKHTQSASSAS